MKMHDFDVLAVLTEAICIYAGLKDQKNDCMFHLIEAVATLAQHELIVQYIVYYPLMLESIFAVILAPNFTVSYVIQPILTLSNLLTDNILSEEMGARMCTVGLPQVVLILLAENYQSSQGVTHEALECLVSMFEEVEKMPKLMEYIRKFEHNQRDFETVLDLLTVHENEEI